MSKNNSKWRIVVENLTDSECAELMALLLENGYVQGYAEEVTELE